MINRDIKMIIWNSDILNNNFCMEKKSEGV